MTRALTIARVVWLEMIRRKDAYVLLILLVTLLFILLSLNVLGLGGVVRYVMDVGLLFAWLFSIILGVSTAARQLPQEEAKRTIYPLLAKPVKRSNVIVGKWLGSWTITVCCTLVFYALVLGVVHLREGSFQWETVLQGFLLHGIAAGVIVALSIAVSTHMTYGAAASIAYILVAGAFSIASRVPELLVHAEGFAGTGLLVIYYALPHLDLFDLRLRIVHEWGAVPWKTWAFLTAYGLMWIALLLVLAWLGYRKKRFKRGAMG